MKLNPDCIRDILLEVESLPFGQGYILPALQRKLSQYEQNDIQYQCIQLYEAGYIQCRVTKNPHGAYHISIYEIEDLTPAGHELLSRIRPEKFWTKFKSFLQNHTAESMVAFYEFARSESFQYLKNFIENLS